MTIAPLQAPPPSPTTSSCIDKKYFMLKAYLKKCVEQKEREQERAYVNKF